MRQAALGAAVGLLGLVSVGRSEAPSAPDAAVPAGSARRARLPGRQAAEGERPADVLAAESLNRSAWSLLHTPHSPPGTPTRIEALCRLAHQLAPGDVEAADLLLDLYEGQGRYAQAIRPAEVSLRARPRDDALGRRWLALRTAVLQTADLRSDLFRRVIAREDYPASLRAAAGVEYARLLRGQGLWDQARAQYDVVLGKWDPLEPRALKGRLALLKDPSPADVAAVRLKLLEGNPSAVDVAWRLAVLVDELGLHAESLELFEIVWQVARQKGAADQVSHEFVVQHCNAMLNAGRFDQAVRRFQPQTRRFGKSLDLAALLAEAYQALGRSKLADAQLAVIEALSQPKQGSTAFSTARAKNLAMFYLVSRPDPARALAFARLAARNEPLDPVVGRLLGAAELASGQSKLIQQGLRRLQDLVGRDLYAAAFLAEHLYRKGDAAAGRRVIVSGLARGGTGPALRRLVALARKHHVPVPVPPGRQEVAALLGRFDRKVLDLALHPSRHLAVTLRGPTKPATAGDPVRLEAMLTNASARAVRLGDWGLLRPRLDLSVTAAGAKKKVRFDSLLWVRWAAPAYLKPGKTVHLTARIDVGELGSFLVERPLDELTLSVQAVLDPVRAGTAFRSWLPSVSVPPIRITRGSLLSGYDPSRPAEAPKAYQKLLLDITRAIKRGRVAQRMRAARQVGALLALVRKVELGRARLPAGLEQAVTKPMLLALMRALLQDQAPAVRAEMLAALQHVAMGKRILRLLAPVIEDTSSLVRLRVVELLGASGTPGRQTIVDWLAQDEDQWVRLMASAFGARAE